MVRQRRAAAMIWICLLHAMESSIAENNDHRRLGRLQTETGARWKEGLIANDLILAASARRHRAKFQRKLLFHELDPQVEQDELEQLSVELNVPLELVTSWEVITWLLPDQACLSVPDLRTRLIDTFSDFLRATATPVVKVDILQINVILGDEKCDEVVETRRGPVSYTTAKAESLTVIVFEEDPTFNTDAFRGMDGVLSISARNVDEAVAINASFVPSVKGKLEIDMEAPAPSEECCGGGWILSHTALISLCVGGLVALCGAMGLVMTWRRRRGPQSNEGRTDDGLVPEGLNPQALNPNPVGGMVEEVGQSRALSRRETLEPAAELLREAQRREIGEVELGAAPDVDLVLNGNDDPERIAQALSETALRVRNSTQVAEYTGPAVGGGLSMRDVIKEVRAKTLQEVEEEVREELQRAERGEPPAPRPPPSPSF